MMKNFDGLRNRLNRLERRRPARAVSIWDYLAGNASFEELDPETQADLIRVEAEYRAHPDPIEERLAAEAALPVPDAITRR